MFKLFVFACILAFAAAEAKPDVAPIGAPLTYHAPLAYSSNYVYNGPLAYPSNYVYSSRSAYPSNYVYSSPPAYTGYAPGYYKNPYSPPVPYGYGSNYY